MAASILAVTSQVPWPLDRGGHLRSYHLLRAIARRFKVTLIAGAAPDASADAGAFDAAGIELRRVPLAARTFGGELRRIAAAAAAAEPYVCFRRHDWGAMRAAVRAELAAAAPDVLYLDHLDSLVFADLAPLTPKVIDLHNVYSRLVERTARSASGARRWYLGRESRLLDRVERRAARTADLLFAVSDDERDHYASLGARSVHVVANGVDCAAYAELPAGRREGPPVLLYVGTLSWGPNADAARRLARDILPKVRAAVPDASVRLVGRDPTPEVVALQSEPGVELFANAADVRPHLGAAHVLAVPLEAGGGSRLKILEAFAAGLPVVSTPVGSEGLEVRSGEHLLIAPIERLAESAIQVLQDRALADRLAERGRQLAVARYGWDAIGQTASDRIAALTASVAPV